MEREDFIALLQKELTRTPESINALTEPFGGEEACPYAYFVDHFKDEGCTPEQQDIALKIVKAFFEKEVSVWYFTDIPKFSERMARQLLEANKHFYQLSKEEITDSDCKLAVDIFNAGGFTIVEACNCVLEGIKEVVDKRHKKSQKD